MELIKQENTFTLPTEIQGGLDLIVSKYRGYEVTTPKDGAEREALHANTKEVKNLIKNLKLQEAEMLAPLKEMTARIKAKFTYANDLLNLAEEKGKVALQVFDAEIKRLAEESARRQQEEENKAAEAKRLALLAEAEAEDIFGSDNEAKELRQEAEQIVAPKIGVVEIKVKNERTIYDFEIEDKKLIPLEYLQPNMTMIGSIVRGSRGQVNIPGVKIISKKILAI